MEYTFNITRIVEESTTIEAESIEEAVEELGNVELDVSYQFVDNIVIIDELGNEVCISSNNGEIDPFENIETEYHNQTNE